MNQLINFIVFRSIIREAIDLNFTRVLVLLDEIGESGQHTVSQSIYAN